MGTLYATPSLLASPTNKISQCMRSNNPATHPTRPPQRYRRAMLAPSSPSFSSRKSNPKPQTNQ
jgi:hypothetical protein